jgi:hypothetical protein
MKKISLSKSNSDVRPSKFRDRQSTPNNDHNKNVTIPNSNGFSKQWNDVKSGWKKFKLKRWNSIGSWVKKKRAQLLVTLKNFCDFLRQVF